MTSAGTTATESDRGTFEQTLACLDLLHRRWPWQTKTETDGTAGFQTPDLAAGQPVALGRYEIRGLLGAGGHGIIYLAHDPSLNRDVAIKVPRPEFLTFPALRARFLREARAIARLEHPNIVPIHDVGEAGPACYLAMALVQGPNLAAWLESLGKPVGPQLAAHLTLSLTEAMAHAHSRGVLHRDLKPGNILLERIADGDLPIVPHITDFGLAKILDELADETRSGNLPLGTPRFASPEQQNGQLDRIGPATDVWGLGTILHAMLSRNPGAGPGSEPLTELADQPTAIRSILARCLQPDPADRYGSAQALANDLQRFLAGKPIRRHPPSLLARSGRNLRRHRLAVVAVGLGGALLGMALMIGRAASTRQADRAERRMRERAGERELVARRGRYTMNMMRARQAWDRADIGSTLACLDEERPAPGESDIRTFMWYYLWRQCHLDFRTLQVRDPVEDIAFLPGGRTIALTAMDGTVSVRDVETGEQRAKIATLAPGEICLAFSADGASFVTTCDEGVARIWDAASGRPRGLLKGHTGTIYCAGFSPDDALLATGGVDRTIKLWDTASLVEVATLRGHSQEINAVRFSPDGRRLASAADDETARIWDVAARAEMATLAGHVGPVNDVAFSPKGDVIATAGFDRTVRIWDPDGRRQMRDLVGHAGPVVRLAFDPGGGAIASTSFDGTVRIWGLARGEEDLTIKGHTGQVRRVAVSADGRFLATTGRDSTAKLWKLPRRERRVIGGYTGLGIAAVAFSADGKLLATGAGSCVKVSDPATGLDLFTFAGDLAPAATIAFSPDRKTLAVGHTDGQMSIWDHRSRKRLKTLRGHSRYIQRVAYSRDGGMLASCGDDRVARIWDAANWQLLATLEGHTAEVDCIAFSPDGRTVASGSRDTSARLWDVITHTELAVFEGHGRFVRSLAFSPDGHTLATGSGDALIRLWDVGELRMRSALRGHTEQVESLAFSPDGAFLASGSNDRTARLWDMETGLEAVTLAGHAGQIDAIALSPDGRRLATAGADKTVRLWDIAAATPEEVQLRDRPEAEPDREAAR